jgi:preprotein translocase SecF subunit
VRQQITQDGAVVQGRGAQTGSDSYRSFQLRLKSLTAAEQSQLTTRLTNQVDARVAAVKNVSSSFSRQILRSAIYAIVVSFALIALYVSLRYRWRFAVPIVRTLLNDVRSCSASTRSPAARYRLRPSPAILTILGYSIYDTIIVFDRVRENMKLMPRATIGRIANVSVWEVLRRSIFTSVITLLPIAALFIFGGSTLQDFAFAILVGISVGAVSTIFIATPLLVGLMERDPEYARRRDEEPLPGQDDEARTKRSSSPRGGGRGRACAGSLPGRGGGARRFRCGGEARTAPPAAELETAWPSAIRTHATASSS